METEQTENAEWTKVNAGDESTQEEVFEKAGQKHEDGSGADKQGNDEDVRQTGGDETGGASDECADPAEDAGGSGGENVEAKDPESNDDKDNNAENEQKTESAGRTADEIIEIIKDAVSSKNYDKLDVLAHGSDPSGDMSLFCAAALALINDEDNEIPAEVNKALMKKIREFYQKIDFTKASSHISDTDREKTDILFCMNNLVDDVIPGVEHDENSAKLAISICENYVNAGTSQNTYDFKFLWGFAIYSGSGVKKDKSKGRIMMKQCRGKTTFDANGVLKTLRKGSILVRLLRRALRILIATIASPIVGFPLLIIGAIAFAVSMIKDDPAPMNAVGEVAESIVNKLWWWALYE